MEINEETARILSCDISVRPRNSAGISELLPYVRAIHRDGQSLTVTFDASGGDAVNSFVDAERQCCTGLTWNLNSDDACLDLRINGTEDQLAVIENWFETE